MAPKGQIQYFRSSVDGNLWPCAVCATDTTDAPKPLIVEVSPGALGNLTRAVSYTEEIAAIAAGRGRSCVVLRPTGRGNGSVYQNYGEIDVFEAIEHVKAHYAIDGDRITITGGSMGGAATWYLISHYPGFFAAAAPFCGYCDYRLWEKPGGLTFHMHEWEQPSWESRSAVYLIDNLQYTPVWIVHGEWDRAVGGGVSVEHSRQMARLLDGRGYPYRYTEVPKTGHNCRLPGLFEEVILWLLEQKVERDPDRVCHNAYTLRHNRSFRLSIDQLECYGKRGTVDAQWVGANRVKVRTENVRTFALSPRRVSAPASIEIDGTLLEQVDLARGNTFQRDPLGSWRAGALGLAGSKRHGASGPIGDLFFESLFLVPGTSGTDHETHVALDLARRAAVFYRQRNGGVHRGGIMGENSVDLEIRDDSTLSPEEIQSSNLILYGTFSSNSVLAQLGGKLPLDFDGKTISICDKTYTTDSCALFAVFPHPGNPQRYVAVHGGVTPDAICWGSHLDMHLLPDYIVYSRGDLIDWGFWGNDWKSQQGAGQ